MFTHIQTDERFGDLLQLLERHRRVSVEGMWGSSAPYLAAAVAQKTLGRILYITAHIDQADAVQEDLELFLSQRATAIEDNAGAVEVLAGWESDAPANLATDEIAAERLNLLGRMSADPASIRVVVTPIQSLIFPVPKRDGLAKESLLLRRDETLDVEKLTKWLVDRGYERLDRVEQPGDFAVRGGIVDIYPNGIGYPVRIELFGEQIESIRRFDAGSQRSSDHLDAFTVPATSDFLMRLPVCSVLDYFADDTLVCVQEPLEVAELANTFFSRLADPVGLYPFQAIWRQLERFSQVSLVRFPSEAAPARVRIEFAALPRFESKPELAIAQVVDLAAKDGMAVTVFCENDAEVERFGQLLSPHDRAVTQHIHLAKGLLQRGFLWPMRKVAWIGQHEIFHRYEHRHRLRKGPSIRATETFSELVGGDYVVHVQHGIGKYEGLKVVTRGGKSEECLAIRYAANTLLQVPVWQSDQVQKYIGGFGGHPPLSVLGGKAWQKTCEKVATAISELAGELLEVQARREALGGIEFPEDTDWQRQMEASFIYQETEDQLLTLADIKADMQRPRAMDRLLCGDVGYGKTELAIRAAFKAIDSGHQVAVLVPTTILAEQHERTFRERLAEFPFVVESLSRFKSRREINDILQRLLLGQVDVVIGTHRILSQDVEFLNLGLLIVDEEQRFGVTHKEKLKQLRATIDVLTLTATPIPRTLHMSLIGLRDISTLTTPPIDRRSIQTEVRRLDWNVVRQAILREINRDGQVYFLHNRVKDIQTFADKVRSIVPEARVVVGHGQMEDKELERVMLAVLRREADVLVCTTIIESGVDIPTVNTILIDNADNFGLAELHQLRGRVGRYKYRAYAYLFTPPNRPLTSIAERRLRAIEEYAELGAGFRIAMRDLEIRGAGNILGPEQSGHIAAVGYEMYCQLLSEAVESLRAGEKVRPITKANLDLPIEGSVPKTYIAIETERLKFYQRVAMAKTVGAIDQLQADVVDVFGPLPKSVDTLLDLARLRILAGTVCVRSIALREDDLIFMLDDPKACEAVFARSSIPPRFAEPTEVHLRPGKRFLEPATLIRVLLNLFRDTK